MTVNNNVDERTQENKSEGTAAQAPIGALRQKRTRGFRRAQHKRARLLEWIPEDALIVAMDLARDEHCIWMMTVKKQPVDRWKVPNTAAGMEQLLARAEAIRGQRGLGKVVFSMEPTGHYWMSVATYLQRHERPYVLVQPLSVKRERQSTYYHYAKSDFRDAELIGNLTADRKITLTQLPTQPVWAALRAAANEYILTDTMLTAEHLRMQSFLERVYADYRQVFRDVTGRTALAGVLALEQLPQSSQTEFLAAARARGGPRLGRARLEAFYQLVNAPAPQWGAPVYAQGLRLPLVQAAERYQLLQRQHQAVRAELLIWYETTGYAPYADTLPHLDRSVHALVLGLVGDPAQYDSSRCLTKFAGVDVKDNESGQYQGRTPITHCGDPALRYVTYLAGFVLKTHDPVCRRRYQYLITRAEDPLQKTQAIIAIGCKYLRTLWVLCTERVGYDRGKAEHGYEKKVSP